MKSTFFLLSIAIAFSIKAQQSEYNYINGNEYYESHYEPIRYIPPDPVKQIDFKVTRGNKVLNYRKTYNKKGDLLEYDKIESDGKAKPLYRFEYNEAFQNTKSIRFVNGKVKKTTYKSYADFGEYSEVRKVKKNQKQVYRNTYEYNKHTCITKSKYFNGKNKLKRKWLYEYYEKCDRSKSMLYNAKGKLINTWTYDCKEEGEQVKAKKNKTQICKWSESDGKYLIKVYQSLDEDGRTMKHVSKYTLQDTLILESSSYNHQEELRYQVSYDKDYRKPLKSISYRSGKPKFINEYTYDGDQVLSHHYTVNGKLKFSYHYTYQDDLLVEYRKQNRKGISKVIIELNYGDKW